MNKLAIPIGLASLVFLVSIPACSQNLTDPSERQSAAGQETESEHEAGRDRALDEASFPMTAAQARAVQESSAEKHHQPLKKTLDLGGGVTMELVRIPQGSFQMGSPESEERRYDIEGPQHRVRIGQAFYLGKYEVTQAQWRAVMGDNPSGFKGDDLPVEKVSWEDCQTFCRKLSQRTGKKIRLSSESEWEYACRAGADTQFSFGDSDSSLGQYAWFDGNSNSETHPVGRKRANGWGLYDMHGNVWEWCEDVWHDNYDGAPGNGSAWTRGGDQAHRVLRGGSWYDYPRNCRSVLRLWYPPGYRDHYSGLRIASGTP